MKNELEALKKMYEIRDEANRIAALLEAKLGISSGANTSKNVAFDFGKRVKAARTERGYTDAADATAAAPADPSGGLRRALQK